ncbi:hypothetical protein [Weeksella virosa]|nr:hypothetical protein [Weeksella virosa]MDK7675819.1 hypothetical protein [Weeksella virosa]SUP55028.1 Uncharacterised protein [Weeksella virosa]
MENITVKEMIYQQMDHFLGKAINQDHQITLSKVLEIAAWVSAFVIRQRHIQQGQITEEEMQMVMGSVGNFCHENFHDNFTQQEFNLLSDKILDLLKTPTFDQDAKTYFEQYYPIK